MDRYVIRKVDMTVREFAISVQEQLKAEGFTDFMLYREHKSPSAFLATDRDGNRYDFRVKFCVKPRKLYMNDIGFMTGLTSDQYKSVLVTNGTDITTKTRKYLEEKGMQIVLNWEAGMNIFETDK